MSAHRPTRRMALLTPMPSMCTAAALVRSIEAIRVHRLWLTSTSHRCISRLNVYLCEQQAPRTCTCQLSAHLVPASCIGSDYFSYVDCSSHLPSIWQESFLETGSVQLDWWAGICHQDADLHPVWCVSLHATGTVLCVCCCSIDLASLTSSPLISSLPAVTCPAD